MLQVWKSLLVLFVFVLVGCNATPQPVQATQAPAPTQTPQVVGNTPSPTVASTATATPAPTSTDTSVPVTATATLDAGSATLAAQMGSMGALMNHTISQFSNPVGTPVQSWHSVPIMPQATAGQEWNTNVYSYIAAATLAQAQQFYQGKAQSLGLTNLPATGHAGTGSQADHDVAFDSYYLTIVLTSYDNDPGHVIVVISKTQ